MKNTEIRGYFTDSTGFSVYFDFKTVFFRYFGLEVQAFSSVYGLVWWIRRGSNSLPHRCERCALPSELLTHYKIEKLSFILYKQKVIYIYNSFISSTSSLIDIFSTSSFDVLLSFIASNLVVILLTLLSSFSLLLEASSN